jgi:RNA polymerase sigma-70 factor (ECF subfamily)
MDVGLSDADLVQQIGNGNAAAESEACRRMGPRIHLYGLRHLRSSAAADDLVQAVLLKMLQALRAGRLRDGEKLAPFVLGTCRMTVQDLRRSGQRQEALLQQFGAILAPAPPSIPSLDGDRLTRCVQALNERERTVVVLTFYDDRTAAETSTSLGVSEANVRVIRHRALKRLRACMEAGA